MPGPVTVPALASCLGDLHLGSGSPVSPPLGWPLGVFGLRRAPGGHVHQRWLKAPGGEKPGRLDSAASRHPVYDSRGHGTLGLGPFLLPQVEARLGHADPGGDRLT